MLHTDTSRAAQSDAERRVAPPTGWRTAVALAAKDLRRALRSRSAILVAVVGPLALGLILALAFGGDGPSATIAIIDRDSSPASEAAVRGMRSGLEGTSIELLRVEGSPAAAVRDGRVDAAVVIPEGWGEATSSTPPAVRVLSDADSAIGGGVAESLAQSLTARSDLLRAAVATAIASGATPEAVAGRAAAFRPAVDLVDEDLAAGFDAPLYFGPLTIFLFLVMGSAARSLVREQFDGTLDRVRAAPVSSTALVSGSSLGVFVLGLVASFVVYGVSSLLFRAEWGSPVEVVVVVVALVISLAGVSGVIAAVARTEPQAEGWTNSVAFLFGILGGAFFGGARLPGLLGAIGSITPNGLAMEALVELGPGGQDLADVVPQLAGLLAIGVVGLVVGGRIMRARFR